MYSMQNGIVDSQKVRAQKAAVSSQSIRGSSFIPRHSEDRQEIEKLKEALRQQDEAMRQRDDFYALAFAQQHAILHVS
jgi:predicted nucleic acid-binding protein